MFYKEKVWALYNTCSLVWSQNHISHVHLAVWQRLSFWDSHAPPWCPPPPTCQEPCNVREKRKWFIEHDELIWWYSSFKQIPARIFLLRTHTHTHTCFRAGMVMPLARFPALSMFQCANFQAIIWDFSNLILNANMNTHQLPSASQKLWICGFVEVQNKANM